MALFYLLAVLAAFVDRLTKLLAIRFLRDGEPGIVIIPDWFKLTYTENLGIAFGVQFLPPLGVLFLTILISVGVILYVRRSKNRSPLFMTAFALILGGGVGNMIDRIMLGHVVDFIYFDLYHGMFLGLQLDLWPIFNVADSCITIGACLLMLFHDRIFDEQNA
ncbi:MAG: signal peptidase II [Chlorobiaceae bacterium]|jgi:signal peptidase II|nr:signal peptidase II [Chlorobiaceae bacterium]